VTRGVIEAHEGSLHEAWQLLAHPGP